MNNPTIHILFSSLLCMAFSACTEDTVMDMHQQSDKQIQFEAQTAFSRGFIDNQQDLDIIGTKFCLYGFYKNTSMDLEGKPLTFATVGGVNSWRVMDGTSPQTYYWANDGSYKFYGWLVYDAAGKLSIPNEWTYNDANSILSIPSTIVDKDYNQFDFIYSDVHIRDLDQLTTETEKYATVPLNLNHLFSAFSIGAINTTNEDVLITKVALEGIHELGSATLDYSGDVVSVDYQPTSTERAENVPFIKTIQYEVNEGKFEYLNYILPKVNGVVGNAFNGTTDKRYYMIWPQSTEVVSPTTLVTGEEGRDYAATDSLLVVEYTMGGIAYKKRVKFPDMAWEAGKKYHFDIQFADKLVALKATVKPWNYTSAAVDFTDELAVKTKLIWNSEVSIVENKTVTVKQGQPIQGRFQIVAPQGGQWRVSLEGDVQAFEIMDDVSPIEDAMGPIDGIEHTIRIIPKISNPDRDYVVKVKFVVLTADGRILAADKLVQDDVYQLILPSVK